MNSFGVTPDYMVDVSSGNLKMPSMHYHASYELYYLMVGHRDYFVEDKLFSVEAGDFVLIPPGKIHRTGGEYGERILVSFTDKFLQKIYSPAVVEELLKCFKYLKVTPPQPQQKDFAELMNRLAGCKDVTESALNLGLLLIELSKCSQETIEEDYVSSIVAYINQNFATINMISDIAEHFYISKYHLCRIFKNAMKLTVVEYLSEIRIKNACQMLSFSDKDISEIAQLCGFRSAAYFSNVFKRLTGKSPGVYRRESRRQEQYENGKKMGVVF